jgi:hypothetical protein
MTDIDTCGERDPMNIATVHNQEMHTYVHTCDEKNTRWTSSSIDQNKHIKKN